MKKLIALNIVAMFTLATVATALADNPPESTGLRGYQGQPGHQGGAQHNP